MACYELCLCGLELCGHFLVYVLSKLFHCHSGLLSTTLLTHGHESVSGFFLANHYHVRYALYLVVAYLAADFLVSVIDKCAYPHLVEVCGHLLGVVVELLRDRQYGHLIRSEPQWEVSCSVLDEDGCETLQ